MKGVVIEKGVVAVVDLLLGAYVSQNQLVVVMHRENIMLMLKLYGSLLGETGNELLACAILMLPFICFCRFQC